MLIHVKVQRYLRSTYHTYTHTHHTHTHTHTHREKEVLGVYLVGRAPLARRVNLDRWVKLALMETKGNRVLLDPRDLLADQEPRGARVRNLVVSGFHTEGWGPWNSPPSSQKS